MNRRSRYIRLAASSTALAVATLSGAAGSLAASDSWEEAGSGAVAILPVPSNSTTITGGSLVCIEQRWSLRLRTDNQDGGRAEPAKVTIDGESFPVKAEQTAGSITLPISYEMIEGLKSGDQLVIGIGVDEGASNASFPLLKSRAVIEAITPRCSQVDMSAFQQIAVSETDPAAETAVPLLDEEMKLFRAATSAKPTIAAVRLDRGEGREMLFATVCGSSWYYGRTGCSLFGFLRSSATEEWKQVYNTEGLAIYVDPKASNGGWPNLVTLQPAGGYEPMHWQWTGAEYALGDRQVVADELRGATDTP